MSAERVVVLTTGGTIACRRDANGDLAPTAHTDVLQGVPAALAAHAEVRPLGHVLGTALSPADLFAVSQAAREALARPEVVGAVITAGTGILEEGCFLSALLNDTGKPVVWTGAQRSSDVVDADGPRNVTAALAVALDRDTPRVGARALLCFNDTIFSAEDAQKTHTTNVAAFEAAGAGPLGHWDGTRVFWRQRAWPRPTFVAPALTADVDLIKLVAGSDERFFRASIAAGARGIIVETFPGTGVVSPGAARGMALAREAGLCVGLAARSRRGRVQPLYGGELGGVALVRQGVLFAGDLAPEKARLLLMVLLSLFRDHEQVAAAWATYVDAATSICPAR
jgi:L-asparaginase